MSSDQLFQLADLEAEGLREDLKAAMQNAANKARRVLELPAGPLPQCVIDLLLTMCRDALVETVPQPFLRVKK